MITFGFFDRLIHRYVNNLGGALPRFHLVERTCNRLVHELLVAGELPDGAAMEV